MTIDLGDVTALGPVGVVVVLLVGTWAFLLFAFVKGWIVPKGTLDIWVQAYNTERASRAHQEGYVAKLLDNSALTIDLLQSIKGEGARRRTEGGGTP